MECGGGQDCRLEIAGETPVAVDPGEELFDDPASWQDDEACLVGVPTISTVMFVAVITRS